MNNRHILIAVLIAVAWIGVSSILPIGDNQQTAEAARDKVRIAKADRWKNARKLENDYQIIYNEGTPHEFTVRKGRQKSEREPDLSRSTITADPDKTVRPGGKITYTITLKNRGNTSAVGIDVLNTLDEMMGEPKKIRFKNCGEIQRFDTDGPNIEFSNLEITEKKNCVISYEVTLDPAYGNGGVANRFSISAPPQGGEEIGPIHADPVTIRSKGGKKTDPPEEEVTQQEEVMEVVTPQEEAAVPQEEATAPEEGAA
jgi:uncharacterized repeat protein (TIGR01451 family)